MIRFLALLLFGGWLFCEAWAVHDGWIEEKMYNTESSVFQAISAHDDDQYNTDMAVLKCLESKQIPLWFIPPYPTCKDSL